MEALIPPELDAALSTRYLVGRAPTANPNPRGKHHRRPLPWDRKKLVRADDWRTDGHEYQDYLWDPQKKYEEPLPRTNKKRQMEKPHLMTLFLAHQRRNRRMFFRCGCEYDDPFLINEARLKVWRGDCRGAVRDGLEIAEGGEDGDEETIIGEGEECAAGEGEMALAAVAREEPVYTVRYRPGKRRAPPRTQETILIAARTSVGGGEVDGELRSDYEWEFLAGQRSPSCRCRAESEADSEWIGVSSTCEWDMGSETPGTGRNSLWLPRGT